MNYMTGKGIGESVCVSQSVFMHVTSNYLFTVILV